MIKCGEKNNRNYTFGRKEEEQIEDVDKKGTTGICCVVCGTCLTSKMQYCPNCGAKL